MLLATFDTNFDFPLILLVLCTDANAIVPAFGGNDSIPADFAIFVCSNAVSSVACESVVFSVVEISFAFVANWWCVGLLLLKFVLFSLDALLFSLTFVSGDVNEFGVAAPSDSDGEKLSDVCDE